MSDSFFDHPILNSPYDYPARYWELDESGQPTQKIIERRRRAEFITPIPKPKKRKGPVTQQEFVFDEGKGISTAFSNTSGEGESYQAIIEFDLMRNKRETPHNVIGPDLHYQ